MVSLSPMLRIICLTVFGEGAGMTRLRTFPMTGVVMSRSGTGGRVPGRSGVAPNQDEGGMQEGDGAMRVAVGGAHRRSDSSSLRGW